MKVERLSSTTTKIIEETEVLVDGRKGKYVTEYTVEFKSESGQVGKAPVSGTGNA